MVWAADAPSMPAPWDPSIMINMVEYQYRNAFTSFHTTTILGGWHSEYLSIREKPDPWRP